MAEIYKSMTRQEVYDLLEYNSRYGGLVEDACIYCRSNNPNQSEEVIKRVAYETIFQKCRSLFDYYDYIYNAEDALDECIRKKHFRKLASKVEESESAAKEAAIKEAERKRLREEYLRKIEAGEYTPKSKTVTTLLAIFLPGFDNIYIGKLGLGILKMVIAIITIVGSYHLYKEFGTGTFQDVVELLFVFAIPIFYYLADIIATISDDREDKNGAPVTNFRKNSAKAGKD